MSKRRLNIEIVRSNIAEAIEELTKLESKAAEQHLDERALQIGLAHAYHHLNFAWNIRHVETARYASLTQRDFKRWSRYPDKVDAFVR